MLLSLGAFRRFLLLFGFVVALAGCGGSDPVSGPVASGAADAGSTEDAAVVSAIPTAAPSDLSGDSPQIDDGDGATEGASVEATPAVTSATPGATPTPAVPPSDSGLGADFDAAIDRLVVDCIDGMDMACDVLLSMAVREGTPQRQVARTCGGRGEPADGFCLEGVDRQSALLPSFQDDSAAVANLGQACSDGDMTACDFLYYRSDANSQWHSVGDTCSGRVVSAVPTCRDTVEP